MAEAAPRRDAAECGPASLPSLEELQREGSPVSGPMIDIELSTNRVLAQGPIMWVQPWFSLTQTEYGSRCRACLISYMCLNFALVRHVGDTFARGQAACESLWERLKARFWPAEDTIDVSTSSIGPPPDPNPVSAAAGSSGQSKESANSSHVTPSTSPREMTASARGSPRETSPETPLPPTPMGKMDEAGPAGLMGSGRETTEEVPTANFGLGVLDGYCDIDHHIFQTLRRMWSNPDLFAPLWISTMMSGSLFKMYAVHKYRTSDAAPLLSLSMLCLFALGCWASTFLMAVAMRICARVIGGADYNIAFLPLLCACGYMQIPLFLFCKAIVWISVIMIYLPSLSILVRMLQVVAYAYFCASTCSTVALYLPPAEDTWDDIKLKGGCAVVACIIQLSYFYWIELHI